MDNFDWKFYIFLYDDLKSINNKEDAYNHYINHGIKENRISNKILYNSFDSDFYISNYSDIAHLKNKKDAFFHYINYGIKEYRITDKKLYNDFDWEFYIFLYDDLKHIETKKEAYYHYLKNGIKEYRIYNKNDFKDFDWEFYIYLYDDLKNITFELDALKHYILEGKSENRICNKDYFKDFEWELYIYLYDDIKNITSELDALKHYILIGKNENRIYNYNQLNSFDTDSYLDYYPNLRKKDIEKIDIFKNYINNKEKDKIKELFDYQYYYNLYPDLKKNNINDAEEIYKHWINFGKNENRMINNYKDFNWFFYKFYYNLNHINSKIEALSHYNENRGKNKNIYINEIMYDDFIIFDYKKYIKYYNLTNISNKKDAFDHWYLNGKMEGKIFFIKSEFLLNENLNKDIGISVSVYSDEKTDKDRILCSKICLNSIVKTCRNINILIIIDYNIEEEHLLFIKDLIENHNNIKLYKNKNNYGIAKTKNIGLKLLEEYNLKYFALLDDDIEIIKNFTKYVIKIFKETNIPLIANFNKLLDYNRKNYFIKTENFWGNILIINKEYLEKMGYFYIFPYKWGEEHVELTKRYLLDSEYNNTAIDLTEYIKNEQIINGKNTINLHSIDIDFKKANENKEVMIELLKNKKYIDFLFDKDDIITLV